MCGLLSSRQLDRLVVYEADKFQLKSCLVNIFNNGSIEKTVDGVSFLWNGREDELRGGTFDLKQGRADTSVGRIENYKNLQVDCSTAV